MKFNLKNFPKCQKPIHTMDIRELLDQCLKLYNYHSSMKVELREKLQRARYDEKQYCPRWDNGYDWAIKEILGDSMAKKTDYSGMVPYDGEEILGE